MLCAPVHGAALPAELNVKKIISTTRFSQALLAFVLGVGATAVNAAGHAEPARTARVLHMMVTTPESGFDPAVVSDLATLNLTENLFDPMLAYDYLARPVKLQPNTLAAMPQISSDGKTYTFRIRPGIFFSADAAFKGKRRELSAADYLYSFKRMYDPALKSPWLYVFEDKVIGDAALRDSARADKFNIDLGVEGMRAIDRYTLQIRLKEADANFLFLMAMPATGAVAREVIDAYPGQAASHPVGTGPFTLGEWQRSYKIVLEANPAYHRVFHAAPLQDPADQALAKALEGKRLPRVDRVEVRIMEEHQSRVLGFLNREFDYLEQVPEVVSGMVLEDGKLRPELAAKGITLSLFPTLQTYYMWMNLEDPVIGGYTRERIALRRAIVMSRNSEEDLRLIDKGLALAAQSPLAPDVLGFDPAYRSPVHYDPVMARALLDRFGYGKRDTQGYRLTPEGKPLTLVMHSQTNSAGRLRDEVWRKSLEAIGLRLEIKGDKHGEIIKASRLGKVMMAEANWLADFPDGQNFYQLLYSANIGRMNYARFKLAEYDSLYEQTLAMTDSPRRTAIYKQLNQLIHAYSPWALRKHPLSADIRQPWLLNYKRHPVEFTNWRYLDIDPVKKNGQSRAK
jgi:ABC-type transport system substrate-binding protein